MGDSYIGEDRIFSDIFLYYFEIDLNIINGINNQGKGYAWLKLKLNNLELTHKITD